jgi:dTMP kinase
MVNPGLFITLEGSEGCGKSTQITYLRKYFEQKNPLREIITLREPGGTPLGEKVRHLLQYENSNVSIVAHAELLLFAASRAQLVHEVIQPALHRGAVVLCDRFLDSTTAYQGAARALNYDVVQVINTFATGGLLPDLTILLDLEVASGRARVYQRSNQSAVIDRMEQEPEAFYESVRKEYLNLASLQRERWIVIDASLTREQVAQNIIMKLQEKIDFVK